jgi:hypothetical protein
LRLLVPTLRVGTRFQTFVRFGSWLIPRYWIEEIIEGPPESGIQIQTDARRRRDAGHTLASGDGISYDTRSA